MSTKRKKLVSETDAVFQATEPEVVKTTARKDAKNKDAMNERAKYVKSNIKAVGCVMLVFGLYVLTLWADRHIVAGKAVPFFTTTSIEEAAACTALIAAPFLSIIFFRMFREYDTAALVCLVAFICSLLNIGVLWVFCGEAPFKSNVVTVSVMPVITFALFLFMRWKNRGSLGNRLWIEPKRDRIPGSMR